MSEVIKLSEAQGELAFDILEACIKRFPEDPELTIPVFELLLNAVKDEVEAANDKRS
uniref:Uncharacterized protein n=2 Tax=unclassified bacterial viruses TaxID=12333 RepID=A0AAU6VYW1_9VIRU